MHTDQALDRGRGKTAAVTDGDNGDDSRFLIEKMPPVGYSDDFVLDISYETEPLWVNKSIEDAESTFCSPQRCQRVVLNSA